MGPAGPRGPRGRSAPLPRVTCTLHRRGGRAVFVTCKVTAGRTARRVVARAGGRTVASATARRGVATLRLRAAHRTVTIVALDGRGNVVGRTLARVR